MRHITHYVLVIRSIRHKGLKRLYEEDNPRGVPAEHVTRLRDILARLDAASAVEDMDVLGFKLHSVRGELIAGVHHTRRLDDHSGRPSSRSDAYALSELVNGKRGISPEMAVRLSKVFGGKAQTWLIQQAQYDVAHVRADRTRLKRLGAA